MAEEDWPPGVDLHQVAEIVSSYVRHHKIEPNKLVGLIVEVHRALASLGHGASPAQEPPKPAVPIRRSVRRDYVVCLECGFRAQALRRHLRVQHGLEVAQLGRQRAPAQPPAAPRRRGRPRRSPTN